MNVVSANASLIAFTIICASITVDVYTNIVIWNKINVYLSVSIIHYKVETDNHSSCTLTEDWLQLVLQLSWGINPEFGTFLLAFACWSASLNSRELVYYIHVVNIRHNCGQLRATTPNILQIDPPPRQTVSRILGFDITDCLEEWSNTSLDPYSWVSLGTSTMPWKEPLC